MAGRADLEGHWAWSDERRFWWLRDYWFYFVCLLVALGLALLRMTGAPVPGWWITAPLGVIALIWLGGAVSVRLLRAARRGPFKES